MIMKKVSVFDLGNDNIVVENEDEENEDEISEEKVLIHYSY